MLSLLSLSIKVFIELEFQVPIVSVAMGITRSRVISAAKAKAARMSSVLSWG
jgi:hypothetical protein